MIRVLIVIAVAVAWPILACGQTVSSGPSGSDGWLVHRSPVEGAVARPLADMLESLDLRVNVTANRYGISLAADGVTDNCAGWSALQGALPSGAAVVFPSGRYFVDQGGCPYGWVLEKPLSLFFEPGAVLLGPLTSSPVPDVKITGMTQDCSQWAGACDGVSSGAADTSFGGWEVENYHYIGPANYMEHPAHAVLLQSGPGNRVHNVTIERAYHGVAIRSSNTSVDKVKCTDCLDLITKSAAGSGSVSNVQWSSIDCQGTSATYGCMWIATSQGDGVETANVTLNGLTCALSAYCVVFEADSGGALHTITAANITGKDIYGGVFSYFGDVDSANAMTDLVVNNARFWVVEGNAFQNSANAAPFVLSNVSAVAVSGAVTVGEFYQGQGSGWSVWNGNAHDPALYSDSPAQGATRIGTTAEYPAFSGETFAGFKATKLWFGADICNGAPGVQILGSTVAAVRYGAAFQPAHCFDSFGTASHKRLELSPPGGWAGIRVIPESDADDGDPSVGGVNAANDAWRWMITKGGYAVMTGYSYGDHNGVSADCTSGYIAKTTQILGGIATAATCALEDPLPNVGTPGTYTKVTTDAKGRVTSGAQIGGTDLPNFGTSGTYTKVTTDAKGRVESGGQLDAEDIPSSLFSTSFVSLSTGSMVLAGEDVSAAPRMVWGPTLIPTNTSHSHYGFFVPDKAIRVTGIFVSSPAAAAPVCSSSATAYVTDNTHYVAVDLTDGAGTWSSSSTQAFGAGVPLYIGLNAGTCSTPPEKLYLSVQYRMQ